MTSHRVRGAGHKDIDDAEIASELNHVDAIAARQALYHVADLPQPEREALLTVVIGDLTYAEAATRLETPESTLKSRVARARAALRQTG
jgi:RNA polymerase sigma-70 factor (ECF subfamily)